MLTQAVQELNLHINFDQKARATWMLDACFWGLSWLMNGPVPYSVIYKEINGPVPYSNLQRDQWSSPIFSYIQICKEINGPLPYSVIYKFEMQSYCFSLFNFEMQTYCFVGGSKHCSLFDKILVQIPRSILISSPFHIVIVFSNSTTTLKYMITLTFKHIFSLKYFWHKFSL